MDRARESLLQLEAVDIFGVVSCGGVGEMVIG